MSFNSIKVQLSPLAETALRGPTLFAFNSIKVQLSPVVFGYVISLFTIGFDDTKLRNLIEKMSMGNYIFLGVLRQPLYLFVLQ